MLFRPTGGLLVVAAVLAVLVGCSSAPSGPAAADVTFVQGMLPHHEQAVAMADLAPARAASAEVKELATRIRANQGPEIERMTGLLAAWRVPRADAGMSGMSGMMGPDQMQQLAATTGPAFDRAFLTMMVEHHRGALDMARAELAQGRDADARDLAQSVVAAQEAEIAEMQAMLARV